MLIRTFLAAAATVALPIAVGAAPPVAGGTDPSAKRTCDTQVPIGSRLGGVRRCRTKAERDAEKAEARQVVDRIQAYQPIVCNEHTRLVC